MSIVEKLRARTEPLNVKEIADLLDVAESTVQRWVRNGEVPAIRISDTIRFDPDTLADCLERSSMSNVETMDESENGDGSVGLVPAPSDADEDQ